MALVTKEFKLDLAPGQLRPVVNASQGDIGRPFKADLYWNGSPWTATGYTAKLRGKKPDNTVFEYTATVSGSSVTFSTTEQMTIIPGSVECELVFTQSGDVIASANFTLMVEDSPYNPEAPSESEVTGLTEMIQAELPDAVADWFENEAATSETFTDAVDAATLDYIDDHGVTVKQGSILPSLDKLTRATTFTNFCPMVKGTIGATVTDGTRWKTNGAVRVETLDNMLFTLNEGYKAMIYLYKEGWTQIPGRPADPDGNGWIINTGAHRLATYNSVTQTHRDQTIGLNIVIAAANGTDVITEEQARAAFKLETIKASPLQKVGEAVINNKVAWYFNVPVHIRNNAPFSIYLKSSNNTTYSSLRMRLGTVQAANVQDITLNNEDLSNGYLITYRHNADGDYYLLMYAEGSFTPGAKFELYADPQYPQLQNWEYKTNWKDTVVVAAANSKARYSKTVDYYCDGVNDEVEIQAAIDECWNNPMKSGNVVLLAGDYHIDNYPAYASDVADRRTAFLVKSGALCVNIKGAVGEQGAKLHIHTDTLDEIDETVDIFACGVQGLQGSQMNIKNLGILIDDQNHPMTVINNYYTAASKLESIRIYALGYGAGRMPVEGLIGVQCSRGSNNGVGQTWNNIGVTGFYEAFRIGSEHLVATDLLSRNSYYGYTFGNYDYDLGWCVHPNVLINCADEFSAHLPLFARNGAYNSPNTNNGLQEVHLIGFNLELRNEGTPTGAWALPAEETQPGTWCGHIDFVSDKNGGANNKNIQFWKKGHGHRFETINGTHMKGGPTSERNDYYPQYMQTYYDTTLNKMLVYDGTNWRDMNGTAV